MVVGGAFLIAGGNAPTLLELVEQPLHPITLTIRLLVESWPSALVALGGDHRPNAASAQRGADRLAAVTLVANQPPGTQPWAPTSPPLDSAPRGHRRQRDLVVALPTGQDEDDRLALPFGPDVDFGADATPRAAERFGRGVPFFAPAAC
jgi:hypothetical protein